MDVNTPVIFVALSLAAGKSLVERAWFDSLIVELEADGACPYKPATASDDEWPYREATLVGSGDRVAVEVSEVVRGTSLAPRGGPNPGLVSSSSRQYRAVSPRRTRKGFTEGASLSTWFSCTPTSSSSSKSGSRQHFTAPRSTCLTAQSIQRTSSWAIAAAAARTSASRSAPNSALQAMRRSRRAPECNFTRASALERPDCPQRVEAV